MPAFERAMEIGVDALEMDVHLTSDGHFVVAHDDNALRTTGARVLWREITLEHARRLDAGWGFVDRNGLRPFAGRGVSVSTFDEVLHAFPSVHINVDLKGEDSVPPMLELLRRHNASERVTLASFQTATAVAVRRAGYAGETALSQYEVATIFTMPAVLWRQLPFTGSAAQIPTNQGPLRFDRAPFIAKCHSVGLRVDFWTIDDAAEAARLLDLGADGIMTNDPAALSGLFD
jgi:glycerophosphoryl diester phosphodiesterase